jgi:hypothetical protein
MANTQRDGTDGRTNTAPVRPVVAGSSTRRSAMQEARGWTRPGLLVCGGAPRPERTGDPILTIDAPVLHNAVLHLTSQHDRAGDRRCRGLRRGAP